MPRGILILMKVKTTLKLIMKAERVKLKKSTEAINNQCSDNEYNHDKVDENIMNEINERENSDIIEQSDTNGDENFRNYAQQEMIFI